MTATNRFTHTIQSRNPRDQSRSERINCSCDVSLPFRKRAMPTCSVSLWARLVSVSTRVAWSPFPDERVIASYLPLISHLRKILAKAQKKSYTISVGKLNPAKLGNFMEIECFVLAACPENSVIESKVRLSADLSYRFVPKLPCRNFIDPLSRHMNWKLRSKPRVHGMAAMC